MAAEAKAPIMETVEDVSASKGKKEIYEHIQAGGSGGGGVEIQGKNFSGIIPKKTIQFLTGL